MLDNKFNCHPHISKSQNHKADARFYLGVKGLKVNDNNTTDTVNSIIQQVLTTFCSQNIASDQRFLMRCLTMFWEAQLPNGQQTELHNIILTGLGLSSGQDNIIVLCSWTRRTSNELASHPGEGGRSRNTPNCFMLQKLLVDKQQPDGQLGLNTN